MEGAELSCGASLLQLGVSLGLALHAEGFVEEGVARVGELDLEVRGGAGVRVGRMGKDGELEDEVGVVVVKLAGGGGKGDRAGGRVEQELAKTMEGRKAWPKRKLRNEGRDGDSQIRLKLEHALLLLLDLGGPVEAEIHRFTCERRSATNLPSSLRPAHM